MTLTNTIYVAEVSSLLTSVLTYFFTRHHYRGLALRNADLRRQIQSLLTSHHCDSDQWRDIERQLSERQTMLKEMEEIGLFFRETYSQAQLDQHKGKTLSEVVIMRLRQGGGSQ